MDVAELHRQVEYKFAPEPLIAVQALANTFAFDPEEERLGDRASARAWLIESELADPQVEVDEGAHRLLVHFRELIRDLLEANLTGAPATRAAELATLAASRPVPLTVSPDGEVSVDLAPPSTVDGVIAQLVGIVFRAQLEGRWPRLKICASDDCRWAFYDSSKNRGGTWCQMEVCGNRIKNRRYRDRRSSRPSG